MTARTTYETTVTAAQKTLAAALIANETTKQETVNASGVNVGYNLQTGNYANFKNAVANANKAKVAADVLAEHNRQIARDNARDLLRDSGDRSVA